MTEALWFFSGVFATAAGWLLGNWYVEWQENRARVKAAEEQVIELWFGDDRE